MNWLFAPEEPSAAFWHTFAGWRSSLAALANRGPPRRRATAAAASAHVIGAPQPIARMGRRRGPLGVGDHRAECASARPNLQMAPTGLALHAPEVGLRAGVVAVETCAR